MSVRDVVSRLARPLDAGLYAEERAVLEACRSLADLERIAASAGGWLTGPGKAARLKLVRHGSGAFLVVRYEDGWSTRLSASVDL